MEKYNTDNIFSCSGVARNRVEDVLVFSASPTVQEEGWEQHRELEGNRIRIADLNPAKAISHTLCHDAQGNFPKQEEVQKEGN